MPVADLVVVVVERLRPRRSSRRRRRRAVRRAGTARRTWRGRSSGPTAASTGSIEKRSFLRTVMSQRLSDECVDLGLVELAGSRGRRRTEWHDRNRCDGVVVELGTLVVAERVLDGELVEPQLVGELVELFARSDRTGRPTPPCRARASCSDTSATGKPSASSTPLRYTLVWAELMILLEAWLGSSVPNGYRASSTKVVPGRQS